MHVMSVGKPSTGSHISLYIIGHTQWRIPMNGMNIGKPTRCQFLVCIGALPQGRNLMNVLNVGKPSAGRGTSLCITELTQEKKLTNVMSVGKHSTGSQTSSYI